MNYSDMVEVNQIISNVGCYTCVCTCGARDNVKSYGLVRAAQNQSKGWFAVFIIFNTAGILPLIYLLASKNPNK